MNRTALVVLAMGVAAAGMVAAILLGGPSAPPPSPPGPAPKPLAQKVLPAEESWDEPELPRKAPRDPRLAGAPADEGPAEPPPPTPRYAAQSAEDKKRLGEAAYADMHKLWVRGRSPRGHPEAIAAMEELLQKFPDTHRAGCARYELGQHHLKNGRVSPSLRMAAAEPLLKAARDRDGATRCEGDISPGNMAAMALAMDVYRHTDRRLAMTILDELAALPADEKDRLGKPLNEKARFLKEHLPPGMANPDQSAPPPGTSGK